HPAGAYCSRVESPVMRPVFACVAENRREHMIRVANLLLSIRSFGGMTRNADVIVNVVDGVSDEFAGVVHDLAGTVRVVPRVQVGPPPANKLRMFDNIDASRREDVLVALDCDTVVMGDLSPLF